MGGPVKKVVDDVVGIDLPRRPAPAPAPRPAPTPAPAAPARPAAPVAAEPEPRTPRSAVYGGGVSQEDPGQTAGKKRRRTRTIMTGSGGVLGGAPVEKKTLLG